MPGGYCPGVLIAYWLGEIGTIGSWIWLMWLISFVHWPGWRMLPAAAASLPAHFVVRRVHQISSRI